MARQLKTISIILLSITLLGCDSIWNNPYTESAESETIVYTDFNERPKFLDPAKSYASTESRFLSQIYEPPLQYHYLLRPYQLEPLTAAHMPSVTYYDADDNLLAEDAAPEDIAYSVYEVTLQPGIYYQDHPAFAKDENGQFLYHDLTATELWGKQSLDDFKEKATREVVAADYAHQIKRLAHPGLNSPILGVMGKHIVGLETLSETLFAEYNSLPDDERMVGYLDLRRYPFEGVEVVDRYTYRIKVYGKYPQFMYWLAMRFFSPMPWEADVFYAQPGLIKKNIVLDWYPIGTGPYYLAVNNPNRQMVMAKNPNFRGEFYPTEGMPEDVAAGLLDRAGEPIPYVDKIVFNLEKESIPRWTKFLQGYYDLSGIGSDNFEQAIVIGDSEAQLSPELDSKNIQFYSNTALTTFYWGFNMLDEAVGGYDTRGQKLRQAINLAMDTEEYITIFLNERGTPAQSPIPPGITGYQAGEAGINPYVYTWEDDEPQRRAIEQARALLAEAGYPNGRDAQTGEPLVLNFDTITTGDPNEKARFAWLQKQFRKLNITLNIRATDYNRFREKMSTGYAQIFSWGWTADYPDPENFLFLLYGANARVESGGVNTANYQNPDYDMLFEKLRHLDDGPEKQAVIDDMLAIIREDSPWIWGFHPQVYTLAHSWTGPLKPNEIATNTLKYYYLDAPLRAQLRDSWNKPIIWPLILVLLGFILICLPVIFTYYRKERHAQQKRLD